MVPTPDWLDRYRAGQRDRVWHELRQFGAAVREPGLSGQAQFVCDEMAWRARRNVEVIIRRLTDAGYRFHANDDGRAPVRPHLPPAAGARAHAHWLQERFGPVPMSLLSWVRLVGDVWLVGTHPQWAESASADPLVIEAQGSRYPGEPIRGYFDNEHAVWRERSAQNPEETGLFVLPEGQRRDRPVRRSTRRVAGEGLGCSPDIAMSTWPSAVTSCSRYLRG